MAEDDRIDGLLARYLELLDTYTTLRTELSELQISVYHSLARANFSAERGIRYGQDFYDERMQATKVIATENSENGLPKFELVDLNVKPAVGDEKKGTEDIAEKLEQTTLGLETKDDTAQPNAASDDNQEKEGQNAADPKPIKPKSKDPLRWFGILSPPSLKQAQNSASKLVERAVELSSVDAEMKGVEIEIRRARKRKVKGEKTVVKKEAAEGIIEKGMKQEEGAKPLKVNRGGGCGRVGI